MAQAPDTLWTKTYDFEDACDKGLITVFDPACGSAGMFVQTGYFLERLGKTATDVTMFYGQEKSDTNTRLARMNMAVHGLEAKIIQGNTFYEDQHELVGKCDFVMSNPPFNVDTVNPEAIKNDPRLFTDKKIPGVGPRAGKIGNACFWALGEMPAGLDGIAQLSILKLRIKTNPAQKAIARALETASKRAGISADDVEELSVPDDASRRRED